MIIKENKINTAIENLKKGKTIIYPTDTLYGLGTDATNTEAVNKINKIKKRITPLSIMIDDLETIKKYAECSPNIFNEIKKILPGPFTILLRAKKSNLSYLVQSGSDKIGIRIPKHDFCLELLKKYKKPIITTSVNLHGQKALNNSDEIQKTFFNIDIYAGNINNKSKGSTILDFTEENINIVRQGDGIYNI